MGAALPERVAFTSLDLLPALFEAHHRSLVETLRSVAGALLEDDRPVERIAHIIGTEHGLYRHLQPREGRVDVRGLVLLREALGYSHPAADAIFAVQGLGTYPIALAGREAQRQAWLPDCYAGERIAGFALTEPEAGSDVASLQTLAEPHDGGWTLTGDKCFISNVPLAGHYVVFAKVTGDTPGASHDERRRITAFIVPSDAAGLTVERQSLSIDHPLGWLRMRGCRVRDEHRLGAVGDGFKLAMQTLDTFRISVGAAANGMAAAALEDALRHVTARRQFGAPLSEQQMVQGYLADMATELDAARLLVLRAAYAKDTVSGRHSAAVAKAKMFATEAAQRVIDRALQLHGGRGVLAESRVEHLYREIRPLRIYEGTTEIQRLIIARDLLRAETSPL
ncbi:MAG: acyl-CoA dehydrogenase family protein [Myxococcota bacterium]